jgi:hypothetical protein
MLVPQEKFDQNKLFELVTNDNVMNKEEAEALIHALVDINESIEKVYFNIIPKLQSSTNPSKEFIKESLWDIREEFRHINYHIQDAKLVDL